MFDPTNFNNFTFLYSRLLKSGVVFDKNIVDTVCQQGLGRFFYIVLFVFLSLNVLKATLKAYFPLFYIHLLIAILLVYLVYALARVTYFYILKSRLQRQMPIIVETYAVVVYDKVFKYQIRNLKANKIKSAIVYKEVGSQNPRYFVGPTKPFLIDDINLEQLCRVFINRRNKKLYTVESSCALQTQSKKQKFFTKASLNSIQPKVDVDNKSIEK